MRFVTLLLIMIGISKSYCQISAGIPGSLDFVQTVHSESSISSIDCTKGNFWSVNSYGDIIEWTLGNGVIYYVDTVVSNSGINSIAFADSMNSGTLHYTFYGSSGSDIRYYDGSNWSVAYSGGTQVWRGNCGGFENYLYYASNTSGSNHNSLTYEIFRFDGTSYNLIVSLAPGRNFAVADLAVDELGNIWTMTGVSTLADSLVQYSSTGVQLRAYPINFDATHAYGSFLLNGIYYVGCGSSNSMFPNSLVAIGVAGNTGVIQDTIPFPNSDFNDLASCQPGIYIPLSVSDIDYENAFIVYPNPVSNTARMILPQAFKYPVDICVSDCTGRKVWSGIIESPELKMFDQLSNGIYFIGIRNINLKRKIIVVH